jgi:hypothetical protein
LEVGREQFVVTENDTAVSTYRDPSVAALEQIGVQVPTRVCLWGLERGGDMPVGALRLTFSYEGERLGLDSRQEVEMTPLASDTDLEEGRRAEIGVRLDLVDREGRVLYRRVSRHLIPESIEMPTEDPERPIARQSIRQDSGTFDVVVPVLEGVSDVVLYRSPPEELIRSGEAEPVFREVLRVPASSPD